MSIFLFPLEFYCLFLLLFVCCYTVTNKFPLLGDIKGFQILILILNYMFNYSPNNFD